MKKFIALLMALSMIFALAACGSNSSSSSTEESTSTESESTESEAAESEDSDSEESSSESNPIHLILATYGQEGAITGETIKYFGDYLEEHSDGEITYDIYYDNTYCTMQEVLDNLSDGTIDVADILMGMYGDRLPYFDVTISDGSAADAVALGQKIFLENEETASAAEAQFSDVNIKLLSMDCSGAIGYVSSTAVTCYDDLKSLVYGAARNADYFAACGLQVTSVDGSELYESLRLGTCQCTSSSLDSIVSNMYYEVAPYTLLCEEYNLTSGTCINLDTYNSMTEEQQALVAEAAEAAMAYNVQLCEEYEEEYISTIETETENEMIGMTSEEVAFVYKTELETTYAASLSYAQNLGCEDEFKAIVEAQWEFSTLNDGTELDLG